MADKKASTHFAQQIRQLEEEGSRLMAATSNLGDSLGLSGLPMSSSFVRNKDGGSHTASPSLKALTDITAEQKTIDDMRHQLDAQTRETERLTQNMRSGDTGFQYSSSRSLLDRLDIPTLPPTGSTIPSGSSQTAINMEDFEYMSRSQLERDLRERKQEVTNLRGHLTDTLSISEKQKEQFRSAVSDLKGKLHEAVVGKETLEETKKREGAGQEAMIYKLQQTVDHLEQTNRRQEETILDITKKQDSIQRDRYVLDMSLNQICSLMSEQERRRGRPFYEGETLTAQNCTLLSRAVEKCIHELDTELQVKMKRNMQLGSELDDIKVSVDEKERLIAMDHQDRLSYMQCEHEKQLDVASERSDNAKHQVTVLQDQLQIIQRQTDQQLKLKEEYISELEQRMRNLKDEHEEDRRSWKEKREALEMACDDTQKELSLIKREREESIRKVAVMESRYEDMQQTILKLDSDSENVKCQKLKLSEQDKTLALREEQLGTRLKEKDDMITDLRRVLDSVKTDSNTQLQQTMANMEKEGKLKAADENRILSTQLSSVTEKCYKLNVDVELAKSQNENLKEKYDDLKVQYNTVKEQCQSAQHSKDHVQELCQSKSLELDRYLQERDRYFKLVEDRNQEISDLKAMKERFSIQLEEREKNFLALKQRHDKMEDAVEHTGRSERGMKEEKDELLRRMNEKIIETEQLRHGRDTVAKKLHIRDNHVQELQQDNIKLAEELRDIKSELDEASKEKDAVLEELKDSRYEVSNLKEEMATLQRNLEDKKGDMGKEIGRLAQKLKGAEHDLRLARKAMKTREHVDGTAVKVAGKMQRQVTEKRSQIDSLQSKIRWLEECLDSNIKEKKALKEDSDRLCKALKKSAQQTERLRTDVQDYMRKNTDLKDTVNKMTAALEKTAVKHAASQATIEKYEQDLARLKLKHQLELKEIERGGGISRGHPKSTDSGVKSYIVSKDRAVHEDFGHSSCTIPTQNPDTGLQEDLKGLIHEMRSVLNSQTMRNSRPDPVSNGYSSNMESYKSWEPHVLEEKRIAEDLLTKYKNFQLDREPTDSYHKYGSSGGSRSSRLTSGRTDTVGDLLTSNSQHDLESLTSVSTLDSEDDIEPVRYRSHKPVNIVGDVQTQELCKRLEKKIQNLSKIGGNLERENKEMSKIMKDQDRKLKKVKSQMVK